MTSRHRSRNSATWKYVWVISTRIQRRHSAWRSIWIRAGISTFRIRVSGPRSESNKLTRRAVEIRKNRQQRTVIRICSFLRNFIWVFRVKETAPSTSSANSRKKLAWTTKSQRRRRGPTSGPRRHWEPNSQISSSSKSVNYHLTRSNETNTSPKFNKWSIN